MDFFLGTSVSQDDYILQEFTMTEPTHANTKTTELPFIEKCGEFSCPSTNINLAFHIAAVLLFGVFGCSSNCITIYLYSKKKNNYGNRFYILLLTYLDMGAIVINIPQFILLDYIHCCVFKWTSFWPYNVMHVSYITTLNAMAIERLVAVVSPFQFERKRKMIRYVLMLFLFLWMSIVCVRHIFKATVTILRIVTLLYPLICVMVLASIYFIITINLLKRSNKGIEKSSLKVHPRTTKPKSKR